MLRRAAGVIVIILLCGLAVLRAARPPRALPASVPDTLFSADRAMRHVSEIAVRPHAMGMADHDRVRDYIVAQFAALGLHPEVQRTTGIATRYRAAGRVQNVLAIVPGRESGGAKPAVLLMAHYDGVEASPAAADDGSGAAALLETARALRARRAPLAHDVILLITDGEEAGLLGAAAFVREHPWAKRVGVVVNLDARGTTGRSVMFETSDGNLDVARVLRAGGDATSASVYSALYRMLPNDTDFSELAVLGRPGLNFAFAGGVQRYHTAHDDVAFLDRGSLQHQGGEALAMARVLGDGPLPRPRTGDAVFFDFPGLGLVVYPVWFALPLAIAALALVGVVAAREGWGAVAGAVVALVSVAVGTVVAAPIAGWLQTLQSHMPWEGVVQWSSVYVGAVALFSAALALGCYAIATRWIDDGPLHAGSLIIWVALAVGVAIVMPAASYLFAWPVLVAAAARLFPPKSRWRAGAEWIAAAVAIVIVIGFAYGVSGVMMGVAGQGATALGALVSLVAVLIAPRIQPLAGAHRGASASLGSAWIGVAAVAMAVVGLFTVRRSAEHPVPTSLVYAQLTPPGDTAGAWVGSFAEFTDSWTRSAIGATANVPAWTNGLRAARTPLRGRKVESAGLAWPTATLVRDSVVGEARRLELRVSAPIGTTALFMRVLGARVERASIDGRAVDTTRYRRQSREWTMTYWAMPDSGAIVTLTLPRGSAIDLELASRQPGLPRAVEEELPPRPEYVVPVGAGDASYVYNRVHFAASGGSAVPARS